MTHTIVLPVPMGRGMRRRLDAAPPAALCAPLAAVALVAATPPRPLALQTAVAPTSRGIMSPRSREKRPDKWDIAMIVETKRRSTSTCSCHTGPPHLHRLAARTPPRRRAHAGGRR
ncbi:hypothetical protein GCM10022255_045450 [Dactylosporangium darangshiense]|uniref:Secreted protein n=1 Tax=Dactylosporangium darangshiense TaxID=579108 RepID=A0ABP8DBK6_9ACTN